ncbi:6-hydroxymethylpterin diphosphokinase MptE-like protein [Pseudoalteromonas sp. T1lg23B]|uniref:6-hydroxymethylpterin diphosphokinase MptE-like protein n=1 Tax=Pseudoalteromonas sp. T1lg23B TaxID=2077097 RepID=UPI000CF6C385|nr:6-hydroxymethylpterin diphosphokinase MptE-like protein [Pseudoalteromonas sp. T1lg23B]
MFLKKMFFSFVDRDKLDYSMLEEPFIYGFPDSKKIKSLNNKFKGKRCFILGNGPSLNKVDFSKLKNEYTFGVNGIFYKTEECGFKPTFYVVEDKAVMNDNQERINDYVCDYRFFPTHYRSKIKNKENCYFFRMNTGFYREESPNFGIPRFSTDASKRLYCGQSVTMMNLQIAFYLGFEKVYLLGMDFSYDIPDSAQVDGLEIVSTEDDTNHFHPDYFGKGKTWHDPQLDNVLKSYKMMSLVYESAGRKIYNSTHGGKLELFERVKFNELF